MPRRDDREAARHEHRDAPETDDTSEATRPPAEATPGEGRSADDDGGLLGSDDEIYRPPLEPERPSVENVLFVLAGALATVLLLLTTVY